MKETVSRFMGESQKYQATTSPPPSVRRWVRAGGRNSAHVSSRQLQGSFLPPPGNPLPLPGWGPCPGLSPRWVLRCPGRQAVIHAGGCLIPCVSKGNSRMGAFMSPQQRSPNAACRWSLQTHTTLQRIQHLCSPRFKEQETRRAAVSCPVSLHLVTELSP